MSKWRTLKIKNELYAKLQAISKNLGTTKSSFLTELINNLYELCGNRESNLLYYIEILNDRAIILRVRKKKVSL